MRRMKRMMRSINRRKSRRKSRISRGGAPVQKNYFTIVTDNLTEKAMVLGQQIDKILPQFVLDRFQSLGHAFK